ncbi:vancomycin permeability regulator SanA [Haloactinospora alba]|uniref:Vancomycin permeability regulator SanA n=1 Tax=Haloactinospora alba TaxID=405555 RepID=A0A543NL25_9ACTN|nr:ElyC/SanA/YdcF family protein [Haloactinospora alba]TQN32512.1 vancomycin permeability regulator SanA [Haloactinospora alba]
MWTVVLAVVAPSVWLRAASARRVSAEDDAPRRPVAIVLGAGVGPDGPSVLLRRRLDIAARLYHRGRVAVVLVSGDNRSCSRHETDTMARYLADRGVPPAVVVADPHGYRTWDTCLRARHVYGVEQALVVTQYFHLRRAVVLCRAAGIDTVGVGDPSFGVRPRVTAHGYLREVGTAPGAVVDVATKRGVDRAGPPVEELRQLLAGRRGSAPAEEER